MNDGSSRKIVWSLSFAWSPDRRTRVPESRTSLRESLCEITTHSLPARAAFLLSSALRSSPTRISLSPIAKSARLGDPA